MAFRKFGTSDDQKVVADDKDKQGLSKEASQKLTPQDRERLQEESKK